MLTSRLSNAPRCSPHGKHVGLNRTLNILGLLPDLAVDYGFSNSFTRALYEVATHPDLSTPVFSFEPWKFLEQELC